VSLDCATQSILYAYKITSPGFNGFSHTITQKVEQGPLKRLSANVASESQYTCTDRSEA